MVISVPAKVYHFQLHYCL